MDTQIKIDATLVRILREKRSWSQEHLASAAGLSTRTIQRVETEGLGSHETRLALAAALEIGVAKLSPVSWVQKPLPAGLKRGRALGWFGWSIGTASALIGIALAYSFGGLSTGDAARDAGVICGLSGFCAGLMGALDGWFVIDTSADCMLCVG